MRGRCRKDKTRQDNGKSMRRYPGQNDNSNGHKTNGLKQ